MEQSSKNKPAEKVSSNIINGSFLGAFYGNLSFAPSCRGVLKIHDQLVKNLLISP